MKESTQYQTNIRRITNNDGGVRWQISYVIKKENRRIRKSYPTLTEAQNALVHFKSGLAKNTYIDPARFEDIRLNDLIAQYERVHKKQRSYEVSKRFFIEKIRDYFKGDRLLSTISYGDLQTFRDDLMEMNRKQHPRSERPTRKLTPATVNRIMATFRHMMVCAKEQWDMIAVNPFAGKPSLLVTENNEQTRYLNQDEIKRLLEASPQHLQDIVIAAINSGMRRGELLPLQWKQIKWDDGVIELPETKSGKAQKVYLNEPLTRLFKDIRRRPVVDSKRVFIWKNFAGQWQPVRDCKTAFRTACKAARIKYGRPNDVTFHTLRHTYGSWLVINGASIYEVRDLMRHADVTMTQRYAHLSDEAKRTAANRLAGLTSF